MLEESKTSFNMVKKLASVTAITLFLYGCAAPGKNPREEPKSALISDCGASIAAMVTADVMLKIRLEKNIRKGDLPQDIQTIAKTRMEAHPSSEYIKLTLADVGHSKLTDAIMRSRSGIADMMAEAKHKHGDDIVKAIENVLPKLELAAQSNCRNAGYQFTSLRVASSTGQQFTALQGHQTETIKVPLLDSANPNNPTFYSNASSANTIMCGLKTVTLSGHSITKIVHEDGTIHTGRSVSNNWTYNGKSITHRIMKEPITCNNKTKSRDEVIAELAQRISMNPRSFNMSNKEASLMEKYVAEMMRQKNSCHLFVDAAKSASRPGMYYVDCNDMQANTKRYWISESDMAEGLHKKSATPLSRNDAISICNNELKARTTNPSTYDPALILGTSSHTIESIGRNVVEINFESKNSFGLALKHVGQCIFESGSVIEVTIRDR